MSKYKEFEFTINSLTSQQMYMPKCAVCTPINNFSKYQVNKIIDFFHNQEIRFINYGSSSRGTIFYNLYRSKKGIIYLIYQSAGKEDLIYYLTPKLLNDYMKDYIEDISTLNFVPFEEVLLCINKDKSFAYDFRNKTSPTSLI